MGPCPDTLTKVEDVASWLQERAELAVAGHEQSSMVTVCRAAADWLRDICARQRAFDEEQAVRALRSVERHTT